jgi:predicted transposase YdaD
MVPPRNPPKLRLVRKRRRKRKHNAHDHLFRYTFGKPRHAAGLLRRLLPPTLARRLAWSTLRLEPGSYVDAHLACSASDVLFSIRLRGSKHRALVYLLFDHQSTEDPMMALRLLKYACRAWDDYTEHPDTIKRHIPLLVPILLHQSPERWSSARRLSELHQIPGARAVPLPTFIELHMLIYELHHDAIPADKLTALVRATLGLMKLVALGALTLDDAAIVAEWFVRVRSNHGHDAVTALTYYLFHTGQDEHIIDAIATEADAETRASMMTIAEKLRARGKAEGKAEGKLEGKAEGKAEGKLELVLQLLALRFCTLPTPVVRRVRTGTLPELDHWAARLLTAATLDDVFTEPTHDAS